MTAAPDILLEFLPFLVPTTITFVAVIGYLTHHGEVLKVVQGLKNLKVFTEDQVLQRRVHSPELPPELQSRPHGQRQLEGAVLKEGIAALASYVKQRNPDWLVGVNFGGRLLSAYIANQIGFSAQNCLFIRRSDDGTAIVFEQQAGHLLRNRQYEGDMLILDDISRTGLTFATIRSFLMQTNYQSDYHFRRVYFATLIEVIEPHSLRSRMRPDWSWRATRDVTFKFPWSELGAEITLAVNLKKDGFGPDEKSRRVLDLYGRIGSDFNCALETAQRYIP